MQNKCTEWIQIGVLFEYADGRVFANQPATSLVNCRHFKGLKAKEKVLKLQGNVKLLTALKISCLLKINYAPANFSLTLSVI